MKKMNKILLTKWLWRYANEKEALWREIIEEKYGSEVHGWFSKIPKNSYGKSIWKGIMNCEATFKSNIFFKVNSGNSVRFWKDV